MRKSIKGVVLAVVLLLTAVSAWIRCTSDDPANDRAEFEKRKKQELQLDGPPAIPCPDRPGGCNGGTN